MEDSSEKEIQDFVATVQGDDRGFERLFKRFYTSLCDYANGFVGDREAAEDVVQDVFVYLWNRREEIEIRVSVRAYLYTAVRHGALNVVKKQMLERRHGPLLTEFVEYLGAADDCMEDLEDIRKVKLAIEKLPAVCRTVFLKSCLDGKKYQEIADEMGISINTVKTHIFKAHRFLRKEVEYEISPVFLFILVRMRS